MRTTIALAVCGLGLMIIAGAEIDRPFATSAWQRLWPLPTLVPIGAVLLVVALGRFLRTRR